MFACRRAPFAVSPELARELAARYSEPHRAYHNAAHVAEVLRWFDVVADDAGWDEPGDVYLAALCHDAIYDPAASHGDNEWRSAELARRHGAGERAAQLIMMTARHGVLGRDQVDRDAAHFLDCDTAILGGSATEFDAYGAAIAIEYGHVPPYAYRAARRGFLSTMLARPRIFLSDLFHDRLDAAARDNLARAISRLS